MTEQMAIEIVRKEKAYMDSHAGKAQSEAFDMAIKALEEIQEYRALGLTPELIEAMQGHNIAMINDLAEYQALGTVEELRVARDKQVAKKPDEHNFYDEPHHYLCPECRNIVSSKQEYCEECGQKLDWSDEE